MGWWERTLKGMAVFYTLYLIHIRCLSKLSCQHSMRYLRTERRLTCAADTHVMVLMTVDESTHNGFQINRCQSLLSKVGCSALSLPSTRTVNQPRRSC